LCCHCSRCRSRMRISYAASEISSYNAHKGRNETGQHWSPVIYLRRWLYVIHEHSLQFQVITIFHGINGAKCVSSDKSNSTLIFLLKLLYCLWLLLFLFFENAFATNNFFSPHHYFFHFFSFWSTTYCLSKINWRNLQCIVKKKKILFIFAGQ
jgi:hypothetical protein